MGKQMEEFQDLLIKNFEGDYEVGVGRRKAIYGPWDISVTLTRNDGFIVRRYYRNDLMLTVGSLHYTAMLSEVREQGLQIIQASEVYGV